MRSSKLVAVLAALASVLALPAAARATTLVTPGADGTLAITDGAGGTGVNGVVVRTSPGEPYRLLILKSAPDDFADPDNLRLAGQSLGCAGASPLLIVCDSALVRLIDATLAGHADSLDTSAVTRLGDHIPEPPDVTGHPAIEVSLGDDDDRFAGGPLREEVRDGHGSDRIATGAGSDTILQSDSDDPGAEDAGDRLEPGAGTDVVSYAARRSDQGVTVTLDGNADDGAPGENDLVSPGGGVVDVHGTPYADTLTGTDARDVLEGRDGADVIEGRAGDDILIGSAGRDTITGGTGKDVVLADPLNTGHNDTIRMDDGEADGEVACGGGADTVIADPALLDGLLEPIGGFPLPLPLPIPIPPLANLGCESVTRLVVDLTAPVLAWTATPAATTDATDARFAWTADGLGGGSAPVIETCRLDGGAVACSAQAAALTGLAVGAHAFRVHSVDLAGNASDAAYDWTITAPATRPPVDQAPVPAPGATPAPAPTDPGDDEPATSRLIRPAGGRIVLERRNRITLRFACAGNCPTRTLELRVKGAGRTYLLPVKVMTALLGESQTVRITIPKRLAAAIRKAGQRGIKAALDSDSGTVARLRLFPRG